MTEIFLILILIEFFIFPGSDTFDIEPLHSFEVEPLTLGEELFPTVFFFPKREAGIKEYTSDIWIIEVDNFFKNRNSHIFSVLPSELMGLKYCLEI
ncbi:MAG: hypothetical protein ACD_78C00296G0001 [uncultured bacterium (gcode 4)]|uniref:Uncharacterized protein n=1 Tax=uncultured bacterium (gcode 4) TaxID=1234023 RepID=K1XX00_9BACT|nr:MAG: hypothetical protein ACD_78C00296G0001 [uncultured bacterium (gcode 4)]